MLRSPDMPKATVLPLIVALPRPRPITRVWPLFFAMFGLAGFAAFALDVPLPAVFAPKVSVAQPTAPPPAEVLALARLMPEGDLIRVAQPHGAADARVAAFTVGVGDRVVAGTLLATLDNLPTLHAARLGAQAQVAQRQAAVDQVAETVRIARLEAQAMLAEAQIAASAAEGRQTRTAALAERGVISLAILDDLNSLAAQAQQTVARAQAHLARWESGAHPHPDMSVAERALEVARLDLERASGDLSRAEVRAPITGTILEIAARLGERPGQEGVVTMGQTDRMFARAEVFQLEIGRIATGQPVTLSSAAIDVPLRGHVDRIGLLIGRQNMVSDDTAANTDARVVEVIVRLDAESSTRAAHLSNLEALARIYVADTP